MMAVDRAIVLDQPVEWAMFAKWLTDLEAGLGRYGLPLGIAALRDQAVLWAMEARVEAAKQPETTEQLVTEMPSETMTTKQVASRFGCSVQYVTAQARCGGLPGSRVRGVWRFDLFDVAEYEKERAA
jgi:excisionase family DNA binding protein